MNTVKYAATSSPLSFPRSSPLHTMITYCVHFIKKKTEKCHFCMVTKKQWLKILSTIQITDNFLLQFVIILHRCYHGNLIVCGEDINDSRHYANAHSPVHKLPMCIRFKGFHQRYSTRKAYTNLKSNTYNFITFKKKSSELCKIILCHSFTNKEGTWYTSATVYQERTTLMVSLTIPVRFSSPSH